LYFQTLDNKNDCVGVYLEGEIYYDEIPKGISKTWSFVPYLDDRGDNEIICANLYDPGITLESACPTSLSDELREISDRLEAYRSAFEEAKVDMNENCFFSLVPEKFLLQFCEIKNKITKHVIENYEKPDNYSFLLDLARIIEEMGQRKLNIDLDPIKSKLHEFKARQWRDKLRDISPYISYDISGTITGRLTTKRASFPILTFPKEYRSVVKPANDWFVELDFNAAELRTLLALSGKEQPEKDMHQWNIENVFGGGITRDEAKKKIFAWLYNPRMKGPAGRTYNRETVKDKFYSGGVVKNCFGREMKSDDHHALNYIIQSTTSDMFLRQMVKVNNLLKDKKSFISFCVHDSLVIDLAEQEKEIIMQIKEIFADTELGKYKVNLSAGKNYGKLKELKI